MTPDRRQALVRLITRLERRSALITFGDIERAAMRRSSAVLPPGDIAALVESAVADELVLVDRRTYFDRTSQSYSDGYVYRVNRRHPSVRDESF